MDVLSALIRDKSGFCCCNFLAFGVVEESSSDKIWRHRLLLGGASRSINGFVSGLDIVGPPLKGPPSPIPRDYR